MRQRGLGVRRGGKGGSAPEAAHTQRGCVNFVRAQGVGEKSVRVVGTEVPSTAGVREHSRISQMDRGMTPGRLD
eukprot:15470072-Alexandrium_andersonii.AAC.1